MYRVKSEGEGEGDCEMMLQDQMDSPVADDVSSGGGSPHPHRGAGPPLKKGPWTSAEDAILVDYVKKHGEGNWNAVQKNTGLFRCGKSCRLRWANHLRPNLKKGAFTPEEERLIIQLHAKMGNKWARMAAHMPKKASWDDPTCAVFLDLVRKQKELCYWNHKIHTPSSLGWTNIWREFNEATRRGYDKKTLQNKYNELKRQYFLWRDGHTQTGLGRDPVTGEVTADPAWFDQQPGESSQPPDERFKRPQCCDILFTILGHTPRDRGELFPAGGHEPDQTSPRWSCWVLAAACWRHFF